MATLRRNSPTPPAGGSRARIDTVILHLAYVSSVPVAGGSLGAETLIPVATLHLEVPGMPEATQGGWAM